MSNCKVYLCNDRIIGQHCGYGSGRTHKEAIADALDYAKDKGSNVHYNPQTNQVHFSTEVRL